MSTNAYVGVVDMEETLFVEVTAINIHDRNGKAEHRLIIEHKTGAREMIVSEEKARAPTIRCTSFIELKTPETRIYLDRSGRAKRFDSLPFTRLDIQSIGSKEYSTAIAIRNGHPVDVVLTLGSQLSEHEAVKRRLKLASDAMNNAFIALDSKERMVHLLDVGITHLSLLVSLGKSAAELNEKAQIVSGIVEGLFMRVAGIPSDYKALQETVLDCNKHFDSVIRDARAAFTSTNARRALDDWVDLIVQASKEIRKLYSKSKAELLLRELLRSRKEQVDDLRRKLDQYKTTITQTFLLEIKGDVIEVKNAMMVKEEKELLEKLLPPQCEPVYGQTDLPTGNTSDSIGDFTLLGARCQLGSRLVGSFFCKRDQDDRRNPIRLIWSIAFFLARANDVFRNALLQVLRDPTTSVNVDLASQFELVLTRPLYAASVMAVSDPVVIVIDALDECDNSEDVARLLSTMVHRGSWFLMVVTSRNMPDISRHFLKLETLRAEYDLFTDNALGDIRKYIESELETDGRLADIKDFIADRTINLLRNSRGLFVYSVVIVNFIAAHGETKLDVANGVLGSTSHPGAETALDELYKAVINAASEGTRYMKTVRMILALVLASSKTSPLNARALHAFLPPTSNIAFTTFENVLKKMSAIFSISIDSVVVIHTTVLDFIGDESRCGHDMFLPQSEIQRLMAAGCFEIMNFGTRNGQRQMNCPPSGLRFNICGLETSYLENSEVADLDQRIAETISAELRYSCLHWLDHVISSLSGSMSSSGEGELIALLADFLGSSCSLFWLEALSLVGELAAGLKIICGLWEQSNSVCLSPFASVTSQMRSYVEQCFHAISASTPHLYLSLTWIAAESELWTAWSKNFSRAHVLKDPIQQASRVLLSIPCPPKVDTFALSPDGTHIASGSRDGYIAVWDLLPGALVHRVQLTTSDKGHSTAYVKELDATAGGVDGSNQGIGAASNTDGRERGRSTKIRNNDHDYAHPPIDALAYTANGSNILCLERVFASTYLFVAWGVSKDSRHIALGCENGSISILDSRSYRVVRRIESHKHPVNAVVFSPDGFRLASASDDFSICIWDVQSGQRIGKPFGSSDWPICSIAISPDGNCAVSGSWDGKVRLWDAKSGKPVGEAWNAMYHVLSLAFSPDGTRLTAAVASEENWSYLKPGDAVDLPTSHEARCHLFAAWDDGTRGYVWARQTNVQIWNMDALTRQRTTMAGHTFNVMTVAFSSDSKRIVSGSDDRSVRVWDVESAAPVDMQQMQHSRYVFFALFSPDGKNITSGGWDNVIRVWDAETGHTKHVLEAHTDPVTCGAYSPDGTRFVSGSYDRTLRLWNTATWCIEGEPMIGHKHFIRSVAFSPDGSCIASASQDYTIRLWDGHTGKCLGEPLIGHEDDVFAIAFSPDGTRIASGGQDSTVRLWDVQRRCSACQPLRAHANAVNSVAFSPDGSILFSASYDRTIRCWDPSTGKYIGHSYVGHTNTIYGIATSPCGRWIASASADKTVRIWSTRAFKWKIDRTMASCGLRDPDRIPAEIPDDGWIRKPDGGLLLCIPDEHRTAVSDTSIRCISQDERNQPIRVLWDKLRHGEKWRNIYRAS
ncbi:WD40 repeat-like protein [Mycena sanguinolenta]|uniref:WD40 repeat-like protein n=1 Tax=Mycena sanguinolenta TaxID=230812 RepID=A0A8H6ZEN7_9AGAR|nr:WD40 repeat-like protein [Mycena sanguinolenta]